MMEMSARQTGITLIESLVVIAIIGIISSLAAPSFQWLREIAEQKQVIQQLHAAVLTARHRSVMMGSATHLCPSPIRLTADVSQIYINVLNAVMTMVSVLLFGTRGKATGNFRTLFGLHQRGGG